MEGLVGYLHYFAYFLVFGSVIKTKKIWNWFLGTSIGISVIVSFYSLAQLAGQISIRQGGVRIDGTLGNATYLAVFMLFNLFFITYFILKNWKQDKDRSIKIGLTIFYGLIFLLNLNTIYHTASRGSILGFIGGILITAVLISFFERGNLRKIAAATLVSLFILISGFFFIKDAQFIQDSQTLSRFANISPSGGSVEARFVIWGLAIEGVKERPVLGWGPESFSFVFNKYNKPILYKQEVWFDRAHNFVFDWLIAGGLPALLAFLSLFLSAVYCIWFKVSEQEYYEKALWTGLIAAYLFNNLFVFDNLVSSVLMLSVLAFIHDTSSPEDKNNKNISIEVTPHIRNVTAVILIGALSLSLYFVNIKPIQANKLLIQGLAPSDGSAQTSLNSFRKLFNMETFANAEASEHLLVTASNMFRNENIPISLRQEFLNFAEQKMLEQIERVPNDARQRLMLGSFYRVFQKKDKAIEQLEKAYDLAPGKQMILVEMAQAYMDAGETDNALRVFASAYELEKTNSSVGIPYAATLIRNNRVSDAEEILSGLLKMRNEILEKACKKDISIKVCSHSVFYDSRIVNSYAEIGMFNKVLEQWQHRIKEEPNDFQAWVSLAATYLELGNRSEAVKTIQTAIAVNPEFKEDGQRFIEQIQNGSI